MLTTKKILPENVHISVVPAQPGFYLLEPIFDGDEWKKRVGISKVPIVAWQITTMPDQVSGEKPGKVVTGEHEIYSAITPIVPGSGSIYDRDIILTPDGLVIEGLDGEYASVEAWAAAYDAGIDLENAEDAIEAEQMTSQ